MYRILLTKEAAKYYQKSDTSIRQKINKCIEALKKNPYGDSNIKRLHGELTGLYRYRSGSLRIVYKIEEETVTVIVVAIGPRGDIYK